MAGAQSSEAVAATRKFRRHQGRSRGYIGVVVLITPSATVSAAMATTAAAQPQHKQGGAPAARPAPAAPTPHAAPAPRAAPAPHIAVPRAAPQMAAPRAAPHIAAPRAAPHIAAPRHAPPQVGGPRTAQAPRAAPQRSAHSPGGPPASAMLRHAPTPR